MSLRWEHVDLEAGELRLPDSKTGAKVVHLGDPAISVLRGIPRMQDSPWVLPGRQARQAHCLPARLLAPRSRPRRD